MLLKRWSSLTSLTADFMYLLAVLQILLNSFQQHQFSFHEEMGKACLFSSYNRETKKRIERHNSFSILFLLCILLLPVRKPTVLYIIVFLNPYFQNLFSVLLFISFNNLIFSSFGQFKF